jgi:DNA (cytosine-5)-methyltransferase 1
MKRINKESMPAKNRKNPLTAIDVFAGGGGLTLGLKRGGFQVIGAVEIEDNAFSTYKVNHPEVQAFKQDIRTIQGELLRELSHTGHVDLLAGCPPCQGFSSLTAKYKRPDPRNELIKEMARLVKEIRPNIVMMENVPGLARKGKVLFDKFLMVLSSLGYVYEYQVLQVADYGVPQSRRRLVLLAGKGFSVALPATTHNRLASKGLKPWRTVHDTIKDMPKALTLKDSLEKGGPQAFGWHVVRTLSPQNKRRLLRAKPGESWLSIPKHLRPTCHQDRKVGFSNVYGRMSWDQASPTITGGCTTLSKGRFGHPEQNRTISVREAALLQTLPHDYIIDTPFMDHACNIVGNALPCDFAEILAKSARKSFLNYHDSMAKTN